MQTDLPLKRLTQLCPADLLPLLGTPESEVLAVESLELPTGKTSLDTLLRLRHPEGTEYLHLIEWQGYRDPTFLWRTLGYLSWLGQNRRERPILATIIYLHPGDDVGDTLQQGTIDAAGWSVSLSCIRLWTLDAATMIASDVPGLATLCPLMAGVTPALVEQAAGVVIRRSVPPVQDELLTVLGIFAGEFVIASDLDRLISKERVMSSTFIRRVFQEEFAASEQREAALLQDLQQMVEETVLARFPEIPARLYARVRQIADRVVLKELHRALLQAPDQTAAEGILAQIGEQTAR